MKKIKYFDKHVVTNIMNYPLPPAQKSVLLALALMVNDDGIFRNNSETLTCISGCSNNTAANCLRLLMKDKYIQRISKGEYRCISPGYDLKLPLNFEYFSAIFYSNLKYNEKIVLISISMHIPNGKDWCYPTFNRIAALTQLTKRSIHRIVCNLESKDVLKRFHRSHRLFFTCSLQNLKLLELDLLHIKKPISTPVLDKMYHLTDDLFCLT